MTRLLSPLPTVTVGANNAASAIAGAVTVALPDARLQLVGTPAGGDPTYWSPLHIYYNGTGNSDAYTSSDGSHPSQDGHDYLGQRLAWAISPPSTGLQGGW